MGMAMVEFHVGRYQESYSGRTSPHSHIHIVPQNWEPGIEERIEPLQGPFLKEEATASRLFDKVNRTAKLMADVGVVVENLLRDSPR